MAPVPSLTRALPPDPETDAAVTEGLRAHLRPAWGDARRVDVSWYLRDDEGQVVGGMIGHVAWGWLYLERVWVDAGWRGQGHGAALLRAAEAFAAESGCAGLHLDTFGDEAVGFYRRQGFEVWGTLEGLPPGGRKHALRKVLGPAYR